MLMRTEAFRSAGAADTVVGFLSAAEVYRTASPANTIASGSYTPHASAAEVVLAILGRTAGANGITDLTVTLNSVAPSEVLTFTATTSGQMFVWMARWRGAPSGIVSITTTGGGSRDWASMITVGLSADRAGVWGGRVLTPNQAAATTTGDQTITSEQDDSLGIFAVCTSETAGSITPDATDTYDERYDDKTAGGTDTLASLGTKALGAAGSKTVEADFTSAAWACMFAELKAA